MPSSFRIIRGADVEWKNILPLDLRRSFRQLPENDGGGDGAVQTGETGGESSAGAPRSAEEIIAGARAEAERVVQEAHERAVAAARELARQAQEEGYREGYTKGYQEGLEKAAAEGRAIREEAANVLSQAREIWRQTIENMENDIVSLAREIAEKLLAAQLTLEPQVILAIVREALELARNREQVVLYVNPEEIALVQQNKEELLPVLSPGAALHIIGDADVARGGCRVETEDGKIEATLEERWRALREALQS